MKYEEASKFCFGRSFWILVVYYVVRPTASLWTRPSIASMSTFCCLPVEGVAKVVSKQHTRSSSRQTKKAPHVNNVPYVVKVYGGKERQRLLGLEASSILVSSVAKGGVAEKPDECCVL